MHDAETRALRRAIVLLICVSAGRWVLGHAGARDTPVATSILPELAESVAQAATDEGRRGRPLAVGERIDPNRASEVELDRLPGVGPSIAQAIVRARDGGAVYRSVEDLAAVRGIGPALLGRIGPSLEFGSYPVGRGGGSRPPRAALAPVLDLNRAGIDELIGLPGVGPAIAERILQRRRAQPFRSVDDLLDVRGIGPATLERLRPEVRVGGRR